VGRAGAAVIYIEKKKVAESFVLSATFCIFATEAGYRPEKTLR